LRVIPRVACITGKEDPGNAAGRAGDTAVVSEKGSPDSAAVVRARSDDSVELKSMDSWQANGMIPAETTYTAAVTRRLAWY